MTFGIRRMRSLFLGGQYGKHPEQEWRMDLSSTVCPAPAGPSRASTRRSWSLKHYLVGLVVLFVAAAGINAFYQRRVATGDARRNALVDARFAAQIASRDIATAIGLARTTVATTATTPGLAKAFEQSTGCALSFAGSGPFRSGHLDIVARDGSVACTSLVTTPSKSYAGESWLARAARGPAVFGPVVDTRTGRQVLTVSAPIGATGALVAFLDLDALGPGLASSLSGAHHLEFLVLSANKVIVGRSLDGDRWVGRSAANTPFAAANIHADHRDLDGNMRLYGQAAVSGQRWTVFAGASTSQALAAANRNSNRQLGITLAGLALFLFAAFVLYRRIARPIGELSAAVRAATENPSAGPITISGPAEVETLVGDFNHLLAAADRELEVTRRLAAIVESSADAIVGETLEGVITSWNAAAENMFGYAADDIINKSSAELTPLDRTDERALILETTRRGEQIVQLDTTRVREGGDVVDVSLTVSPIRNAIGAVTGASTVCRDMTEHNRAEIERRVLEDRLRQSERLESLGQLAGGIAHDFNNLLAAIINYAAFAAEELADRPAVLADVEQIQSAAERAARLTKQLLIFGRCERIQPETIDLNAIVSDINNLLSRSIGEHIQLNSKTAIGLPTIRADRGQIEQVLVNLAVNARDAMPDGGSLTIETNSVELDEGYAGMHPTVSPGAYVELTISDTGTGMSADILEHIFEPFFTTKAKGEGTGLGLATTYGIVIEAAGSMSVYSEQGIGTTFRLYFPATNTPAVPPSTAAVPPRAHGEAILVAEDDPAVLALTSRILRSHGYAVLEAASYEQAITLAAAEEFQLLLTDSVMPHMSGRALAQRVEELKPGRAVLYMSGYSLGVIGPQRILEPGAAFIQKPFSANSLLEGVRTTLAARNTC